MDELAKVKQLIQEKNYQEALEILEDPMEINDLDRNLLSSEVYVAQDRGELALSKANAVLSMSIMIGTQEYELKAYIRRAFAFLSLQKIEDVKRNVDEALTIFDRLNENELSDYAEVKQDLEVLKQKVAQL
jgi:tetratricopeptide (TPR) repeat protein